MELCLWTAHGGSWWFLGASYRASHERVGLGCSRWLQNIIMPWHYPTSLSISNLDTNPVTSYPHISYYGSVQLSWTHGQVEASRPWHSGEISRGNGFVRISLRGSAHVPFSVGSSCLMAWSTGFFCETR